MNPASWSSIPNLFDLSLPLALAWLSPEGHLLRTNAYWQKVFGHYPEKNSSICITDISPKFEWDVLIEQILDSRSSKQFAADIFQNDILSNCQLSFEPIFEENHLVSIVLVAESYPSLSISNQKLELRMEDRTNKLQAIFDVIAVATEAHEKDLGTVLQGCLEQVIDSTYASGGAIQLLDSDEEFLELQAHAGLENEIVSEMQESSAESGLFGWTASHQEKLILPDLMSDWRTSEVIRNSDVNVYAGVPMNAEGELVGVLSIFREKKRAFSSDDISILASIADQIGVIIANHRLRAENDRLMLLEERNRLARELHDAVTQSLYSSVLLTEALKTQANKKNLIGVEQISDQLQSNAHQALKEMRLLIHNLRPSILSSVGLTRAIRHRLKAVEERAGIKHQLNIIGQIDLPKYVEETLYFVTQEALNNSLKHANASNILVTLKQSDMLLTINMMDDGTGFDTESLEDGGLGLVSMQERMHQIGGEVVITSTQNKGTNVKIIWGAKI